MPRVNTISMREELERLQQEFERLSAAGKVRDEMKVLVQGMFVLFEVMVAVFLEKTTKKSTKTSSIPSSQTDKDESALDRQGSNSRGRKETQIEVSSSRITESVQVSQVEFCSVCGEDLEDTPCDGHERRTKIDIVFEKVIEHVDAEIKTCPSCNSQVKAGFPQDMPGPLQYGKGLRLT